MVRSGLVTCLSSACYHSTTCLLKIFNIIWHTNLLLWNLYNFWMSDTSLISKTTGLFYISAIQPHTWCTTKTFTQAKPVGNGGLWHLGAGVLYSTPLSHSIKWWSRGVTLEIILKMLYEIWCILAMYGLYFVNPAKYRIYRKR